LTCPGQQTVRPAWRSLIPKYEKPKTGYRIFQELHKSRASLVEVAAWNQESRPDVVTAHPSHAVSVTKAGFRLHLDSRLLLLWETESPMSTQTLPIERKLTKYFRAPDQEFGDALKIAMRFTVNTDAARIFQALTKPEYLETWVSLPGDDGSSYLAAWRDEEGFRLDHYRGGRRDLIIRGTYRICRRRKMLFTWTMTGDRLAHESLVYVRLHGNFTSTIVELHHRGISSMSDYSWQKEMWRNSIDRLVRLFPGQMS
jgi:uncharacterized protein YndB with AHSA1/START domain